MSKTPTTCIQNLASGSCEIICAHQIVILEMLTSQSWVIMAGFGDNAEALANAREDRPSASS